MERVKPADARRIVDTVPKRQLETARRLFRNCSTKLADAAPAGSTPLQQRLAKAEAGMKRRAYFQHKAIPFLMGNRWVRKRVYFRWCMQRGFNPTDMQHVKEFANRKRFQKARAI